jgi:hypothetical protein
MRRKGINTRKLRILFRINLIAEKNSNERFPIDVITERKKAKRGI